MGGGGDGVVFLSKFALFNFVSERLSQRSHATMMQVLTVETPSTPLETIQLGSACLSLLAFLGLPGEGGEGRD